MTVPQKHRPAKGTTLTPEICLHTDAADLTVEDAYKTMAQRPPEDQVRIVTRSSTLEDSLVILIRRNQQHSLCRSDVAKRRGKQRKRGSGFSLSKPAVVRQKRITSESKRPRNMLLKSTTPSSAKRITSGGGRRCAFE